LFLAKNIRGSIILHVQVYRTCLEKNECPYVLLIK